MTGPAVRVGAWLLRPVVAAACGCLPRWGLDATRSFGVVTVHAQVRTGC